MDYESDSTLLCNKQAQSAVSAPVSAGFFESKNTAAREERLGGFVWTLTKIEASSLRILLSPLNSAAFFYELTYLSLVALRGKRGREGV